LDRRVQIVTGASNVQQPETLSQTSIEPGRDSDGSTWDSCPTIRSGKPLRILVVEDDPVDLMAMQRMLRASPETFVELSNVSSLAGALGALDRQCPDVVLLGLDLPDSRGLDTLHRLISHSTQPTWIILTKCQSDQTARQAVALGVQDYLVKADLNPRSLSRAILHAVDRRRVECRLPHAHYCVPILSSGRVLGVMIMSRLSHTPVEKIHSVRLGSGMCLTVLPSGNRFPTLPAK
jgi:CheY-like chemotaxis protein